MHTHPPTPFSARLVHRLAEEAAAAAAAARAAAARTAAEAAAAEKRGASSNRRVASPRPPAAPSAPPAAPSAPPDAASSSPAPGPAAPPSLRPKLSFARKSGAPRTGTTTPPPLTPQPQVQALPDAIGIGENVWYVSLAGHVRHVSVQAQADANAAGEPQLLVKYKTGSAPAFLAEAGRIFRQPPDDSALQELQRAAQAAKRLRSHRGGTGGWTEEEKLERSRRRRAENLRLLKEQMARNWTLWHPQCRPAGAQPLIEPIPGFEDIPQEVLEYGHYLGMIFPEDGRFLWIAEEALGAPLPPEWTMCKDPEGLVYFYQAMTGVASRQHPLDEEYRNLYYDQKFDDAAAGGQGSYLKLLIRNIGSRHVTDALKNLSREEIERATTAFSKLDPEGSGFISLDNFLRIMEAQFRRAVKFHEFQTAAARSVTFGNVW